MLEDIPYDAIKKDKRAYEIMLLRDQKNNTITDIAKKIGLSDTRALKIYNSLKCKQSRLYINHISVVLGYDNTAAVKKIYDKAYDCYQGEAYACAYLEKEYKNILKEYRNGEPGMPEAFIQSMPPLKCSLTEEEVHRIIEMHEAEKASFAKIGKTLHITKEKAKSAYNRYYFAEFLEMMRFLQANKQEKIALWYRYFEYNYSPKTRYEMLKNDISKALSSE